MTQQQHAPEGWTAEDALAADPFSGDFDTSTLLSDKIVKAGKLHVSACHDCAGDIAEGERHRVRVDRDEGELSTFRWCGKCCRCMAEGDDEAAEERIELGNYRRAALARASGSEDAQ